MATQSHANATSVITSGPRTILGLLWLVLALITLIFGWSLAQAWKDAERQQYAALASNAQIIHRYFQLSAQQREVQLQTIGERLVERGAMDHPAPVQKFLEDTLSKNPSLAGLALARPDGQLVLLTGHSSDKPLPSLTANPDSARTFYQATRSSGLHIGATYYFKTLDLWVIPLRVGIRTDEDELVAIMATGLTYVSLMERLDSFKLPPTCRVHYLNLDDESHQLIYPMNPQLYDRYLGKRTPLLDQIQYRNERDGMRFFTALDLLEDEAVFGVELLDPIIKQRIRVTLGSSRQWQAFQSRMLGQLLIYALIGGFLITVFVLLQRREARQARILIHNATHDELTNMPNRRVILEETERSIAYNRLHGTLNGVIFIDLDHFKNINDQFGHRVGDEVLVAVANRLSDQVGIENLIGRQGGDEFIVLIRQMQSEAEAIQLVEHILRGFEREFPIRGMHLRIRASFGIALGPLPADSAEDLLRRADSALYLSKDAGRGRYAFFSEALNNKLQRRMAIESELRDALARNEFQVHYQPQIESESRNIIGVEALLRWNNARLGQVGPDEFIPIAEDIGLIFEIDSFVMATGMFDMQELERQTGRALTLSINISAAEFLQSDMLSWILEHLDQTGFPAQRLVLEITETAVLKELDQAINVVRKLRERGVQVSLDDFGTGYSSLSFLHRLPVNEIKIDKSFIRDILDDEHVAKLVCSIIYMGKMLGKKVVAEGVETEGQYDLLLQEGCDLLQGYCFARPQPREQLFAMVDGALLASPSSASRTIPNGA